MPIEIRIDPNNKKQVTQALKQRFSELGYEVSASHALEAIAAIAGHKSWNVASTLLKASEKVEQPAVKSEPEQVPSDFAALLNKGTSKLKLFKERRREIDDYFSAVNQHLKEFTEGIVELRYGDTGTHISFRSSLTNRPIGEFQIPLECYPFRFEPTHSWSRFGHRHIQDFPELKAFIAEVLSSPIAAEVIREAMARNRDQATE